MAFVNLPPSLQDIFYKINDRLAKLETGPSQAMYTAESAQSTSGDASAQATAAYNAAITASAQATAAAYAAGVAQTSANGKNTTHYSIAGPSGGGQNGDIWFQVDSGGTVLYQYVYNGSSWISSPISNTVIANLDAGKINGGTIRGIAYNNGSGTFSVDPSGNLVATSATIQGVIRANSGYFTGQVNATTGNIGGFTLGNNFIGDPSTGYGMNSNNGFATFSIAGVTGLISSGSVFANGSTSNVVAGNDVSAGNNVSGTHALFTGSSQFGQSAFSGPIYNNGITTGSGTLLRVVVSNSRYSLDTSSERFKQDVKYLNEDGWLDKVASMKPIEYKTNEDFVEDGEDNLTQVGFLAEDVSDLGGRFKSTVIYDPLGDPFSLSYDRLTVFITMALKEIKTRLDKLENK